MSAGFRSKADKAFSLKGLDREEEKFRYLSWTSCDFSHLEKLSLSTIDKKNLPPKKWQHRIVMVAGVFKKELSCIEGIEDQITLLTQEEAYDHYSSLIHAKEEKFFSCSELCGFQLWNAKEATFGLFLYAPAGFSLDSPVEILEVFPSSQAASAGLHRLVFGKNVRMKLYHHVIDKGQTMITSSWDMHLEPSAHVDILCDDMHRISPCFIQTFALLKNHANLKFVQLDKGAALLRKGFDVELVEKRAQVSIKGLSLLKGKKQTHVGALVKHMAPECQSHQHFKLLLMDQSRGSFLGKIFVDPLAQKTQAYQLSNQLLLSERAQGFARPQLEILADDVKASHGATVTKLKQEELFYLRSRGLSEKSAKDLLLKGFCQDILEQFSCATAQEFLKDI